jgi:predicted nucleotidyltransferase
MEGEAQLTIDTARLKKAIQDRGYATAMEFAEAVGVHRNTLGNYLSGRTALPNALARILTALDLAPADVLSLPVRRRQVPGLAVADLVQALAALAPHGAFVLFGSRARGTAKPYSDYDIGFFGVEALDFAVFSRMLDRVAEWNEQSLSTAQLVDLTRAEEEFAGGAVDEAVFIGGSYAIWCEWLRTGGMQLHE